jgi:arylsulfatase A-like enzyme
VSAEEADLLESLYDAEVAAVDDEIRRLFERLERRNFFQNAVIVVTADHGEEFGQHQGVFGHGLTLYQGEIRVPLLVIAPGFSGSVVLRNVSLLDVAPTVLELTGLLPARSFEGRSLVPLMKSATSGMPLESDAGILSELPRSGSSADLRRHTRAFLEGSHKILTTPGGSTLLYDLAQDPTEGDPVAAESSSDGALLDRSLAERVAALTRRTNPEPKRVNVDEATREKLRALGYHADP